jgi:hypothetical protein
VDATPSRKASHALDQEHGLSASDVWMTGWGKVTPAGDQNRHPLALHWNGCSWSSTPVPAGRGELFQATRTGHGLWAAVYRFLATVPGLTVIHNVRDAAGRPGVGLAWSLGRSRAMNIFDPRTYVYLGAQPGEPAASRLVTPSC